VTSPTTYDSVRRRQAKRKQRERGAWLYVPAVELEAAGIDPSGPPPFYRIWPKRKRTLFVQLYTEQ
jgi:hypothetical protein